MVDTEDFEFEAVVSSDTPPPARGGTPGEGEPSPQPTDKPGEDPSPQKGNEQNPKDQKQQQGEQTGESNNEQDQDQKLISQTLLFLQHLVRPVEEKNKKWHILNSYHFYTFSIVVQKSIILIFDYTNDDFVFHKSNEENQKLDEHTLRTILLMLKNHADYYRDIEWDGIGRYCYDLFLQVKLIDRSYKEIVLTISQAASNELFMSFQEKDTVHISFLYNDQIRKDEIFRMSLKINEESKKIIFSESEYTTEVFKDAVKIVEWLNAYKKALYHLENNDRSMGEFSFIICAIL